MEVKASRRLLAALMFNFSSLAWGVFFERVRKCAVWDIRGSVCELSFVKCILWTKTPTFYSSRRILSVDPLRGLDWDGWGPAEPSVDTCKTLLSVVKYIKPAKFWTLKHMRLISITRITRLLASYQVISVQPACTCALSYQWEWNFTSTQLLWQPGAERWRSRHCAGLSPMRKWSPAVSHPALVVPAFEMACTHERTHIRAHTTPPWAWEILRRSKAFLLEWSAFSWSDIHDNMVSPCTHNHDLQILPTLPSACVTDNKVKKC